MFGSSFMEDGIGMDATTSSWMRNMHMCHHPPVLPARFHCLLPQPPPAYVTFGFLCLYQTGGEPT